METQQTNVQAVAREKLWTWNFFLLWQGQFVSAFGDVIYNIALGFWVLAETGSTALMGTLMAASVLPRIIISPFAGVLVDRSNRRNLIVWMDVIRGVFIVFVGIAAYMHFIEVWMVFAAAVIMGICAAFFNPAVQSAIPDIVPKSTIMRANSVFSMIYAGTNIIGNPIGGIVFQIIGAPFMFLFNGISYLFSAFTEIFIKIPPIENVQEKAKINFWADLKDGFVFVWNFRALRNLILIAAFLNFFGNMAMVLFLPYFQKTEWLGPERYGIALACLTGGAFLGMLVTSIYKIPPTKRMTLFMIFALLTGGSFIFLPVVKSSIVLYTIFVIGGLSNSIVNVFFGSSIQQTVPQHMRGKVFALMGTLLQSFTPIAMAFGGILAEFVSIKVIVTICFAANIVGFIPFAFMPSFRRFINFDPEKETVEEIM